MSHSKCNLVIFAERHIDAGTNHLLLSSYEQLKRNGFDNWLFEYGDSSFQNVYDTMKKTSLLLERVVKSGLPEFQSYRYLLDYYKTTLQLIDKVKSDFEVNYHNIDDNYQHSHATRDVSLSLRIHGLCDHGKTKLVLRVGYYHIGGIFKLLKENFNIFTFVGFKNPLMQEKDLKNMPQDQFKVFYGDVDLNSMIYNEAAYAKVRTFSETTIKHQSGAPLLPFDLYHHADIDVSRMIGDVLFSLDNNEL